MPPYTRREWGKLTLAGLPGAASLLELSPAFADASAKPSSTWAGVHVGMNVPYNFGTRTTLDAVAERICRSSAVEMPMARSESTPALVHSRNRPKVSQTATVRLG